MYVNVKLNAEFSIHVHYNQNDYMYMYMVACKNMCRPDKGKTFVSLINTARQQCQLLTKLNFKRVLTLTVPAGRSLSSISIGCGLVEPEMKPTARRNIWSKLMAITIISICFVPGFVTYGKQNSTKMTD